ncbi:MAG: hypothetical protein HY927_06150 [Elusimicrobia bacterium]|nr:hypothetical protein [Elusimicrobiota bacterium]
MLLAEWHMSMTTSPGGRPGRIEVAIQDVDERDHDFAAALAHLVEVWLNARRSQP